jgi:hypothetical protein
MKQDLEQIKRTVDLELVLQHYGYTFVKSKSSKLSRFYRKGEQRISVILDASFVTKFFVDLNDPQFKGDIFKFMERMEHGNYRSIFQTIDLIRMQNGFAEKKHTVEPTSDRRTVEVPAPYFLKDTLLREQDLYRRYRITPLTDTAYLEGRSIAKEVLFSKEFEGRIKNAVLGTGAVRHLNTAFPMYARDGNMVSMDIRNVAFKAFPEGERGEALWHSNRFFEVKKAFKTEKGLKISSGMVGIMYPQEAEKMVFRYGKSGEEKRVILSVKQAKTGFYVVPVHRIVLTESAIDAISFQQLNPEQANERRLYVATCGQPGGKQMAFLQEILNQNPQAQWVIAQDGDKAGLRFAVNYLALNHPSENPEMKIKPFLTFSASAPQPVNQTEASAERPESAGTNHLSLELRYPLALGARKAQQLNEDFIRNLSEDLNLPGEEVESATMLDENMHCLITRATIHFPNDTESVTKALNRISEEIEKRQQQKLFQLICPNPQQKDLNEVLKQRNGHALPAAHSLKLPELPVIKPYREIQDLQPKSSQSSESPSFGEGKRKTDF